MTNNGRCFEIFSNFYCKKFFSFHSIRLIALSDFFASLEIIIKVINYDIMIVYVFIEEDNKWQYISSYGALQFYRTIKREILSNHY